MVYWIGGLNYVYASNSTPPAGGATLVNVQNANSILAGHLKGMSASPATNASWLPASDSTAVTVSGTEYNITVSGNGTIRCAAGTKFFNNSTPVGWVAASALSVGMSLSGYNSSGVFTKFSVTGISTTYRSGVTRYELNVGASDYVGVTGDWTTGNFVIIDVT